MRRLRVHTPETGEAILAFASWGPPPLPCGGFESTLRKLAKPSWPSPAGVRRRFHAAASSPHSGNGRSHPGLRQLGSAAASMRRLRVHSPLPFPRGGAGPSPAPPLAAGLADPVALRAVELRPDLDEAAAADRAGRKGRRAIGRTRARPVPGVVAPVVALFAHPAPSDAWDRGSSWPGSSDARLPVRMMVPSRRFLQGPPLRRRRP